MNAYYMLLDVRDNIAEATASKWGDNDILRKLNFSHRLRAMELMLAAGDWLIKSTTLTPSNSIVTLPSDCAKPVYMEEATNGYEIPINGTVRERRLTRMPNASLFDGSTEGYLLKDTIEINQESFTDQVKLWYVQRIADLHTGTADAGGTTSLTLAAAMEPHLTVDYYNDQYIDIISGTGSTTRDQITDYAANTRVCTVTGTYASDSVYGTVSQLPEEAWGLVVLDATLVCLASPSAALDPKYFEYFTSLKRQAAKDWGDWISSRISASKRIRITEPY